MPGLFSLAPRGQAGASLDPKQTASMLFPLPLGVLSALPPVLP